MIDEDESTFDELEDPKLYEQKMTDKNRDLIHHENRVLMEKWKSHQQEWNKHIATKIVIVRGGK